MKSEMFYWRGKHSGSRDIVVTCAPPAKKLMEAQTDVGDNRQKVTGLT